MAHEHHHEHEGEQSEVRGSIIKIAVAAVLLIACIIIEKTCNLSTWQLLLLYLIPYLLVGWETIHEAIEGLLEGEPLNEDFLMTIATVGALCIGFLPNAEAQFPEAVFVMLFFQIGELFEGIAEGKSRRSISSLMDIRPDSANVERGGEVLTVDPSSVEVGEIVLVRPGEKVPMDGVVVEGSSSLDTVALTGESVPRKIQAGDDIASGCVNLSGVLRIRVQKPFGESTASKILDLVENASENKSKSENFITRFCRWYTPVVVGLAVILAVVPPLFGASFSTWLYRALCFLIVSCPCALVISVPLAFFSGIGGASKKGILVKGSNWLEALSKVSTVVFDKTGTLTKGVFEVSAVHPEKLSENELLHLAAHVERGSTHPIAVSLLNAYPNEHDDCKVSDAQEIAGQGVVASVNGKRVAVGNSKLMDAEGAAWHPCEKDGTIVHVAIDGEYAGHIVISDVIKEDSASAIAALKAAGVSKTVMLTGDSEEVGASVAAAVGLDEFHAGLLPADKVAWVERLMSTSATAPQDSFLVRLYGSLNLFLARLCQKPNSVSPLEANANQKPDPAVASQGSLLAFVGDGINDAPVLARADVGIAMGALGSDAAIEAADVVLMDDKPSKLPVALRIARKTVGIARQNTWFAIAIKVLVLVLATFGLAAMWMAVFADVGVTVLAILNSMRALR